MNTKSASNVLREVAALFDLRADFVNGAPYGSGHINDVTWLENSVAGNLVTDLVVIDILSTQLTQVSKCTLVSLFEMPHHRFGRAMGFLI